MHFPVIGQELHSNELRQVYNHERMPLPVNSSHWHVLGAGAMGCLFASQLQQAGCPVTLVLRQTGAAATARVQLARNGDSLYFDTPVSCAAEKSTISHLLVTTKAQDVCVAVLSVAHRLSAQSQILLLSNGLGYARDLQERLPRPQYFYGTTTAGAYRIDDHGDIDPGPGGETPFRHIRHAGQGLTRIGQPGRAAPPDWFSQWSTAVQPSSWDPHIEQALWLKLAINCAINPLTALHRCSNGELAAPGMAPQVTGLCDEIVQVSEAAGYGGVTADLHARVSEVIEATASNRSSMLQDVLAGRQTEIQYITGHLLSVARAHGVDVPRNEALFRSILARDN